MGLDSKYYRHLHGEGCRCSCNMQKHISEQTQYSLAMNEFLCICFCSMIPFPPISYSQDMCTLSFGKRGKSQKMELLHHVSKYFTLMHQHPTPSPKKNTRPSRLFTQLITLWPLPFRKCHKFA